MSSVKIRTNDLKDGRKSIYLDIYHNKRTTHKVLKLYLNPPTSPEAKKQNEQIMLLADKFKIKVQEQILDGSFGQNQTEKDVTLLEWFTYLTEQRRRNEINYPAWRSMLKHLKAFFSNRSSLLLKDITPTILEDIKDYLLGQVSQNSTASYFDVLKHSLYDAHRRKLIVENPADFCKSVKYKNPHREFLTEDELIKLVNTDCDSPEYKRAFLFSCFTSLRFSDCQSLTWENIQYTNELGYFIRFIQQKTKGSETLPLSETAIEIIGKPTDNCSGKIFKGLKYSAWHNGKLALWFIKAGISKKSHFHMARHTAAVMLLQKGVDIYTVSKILGHEDLKSTMVYANIVDIQKRSAVNLLPNLYALQISKDRNL